MADKIKNYVTKLDTKQIKELETILINQGWDMTAIPYAHWKAKKEKTNIVAYQSGKLVIQGKDTEDIVLFIVEPEILKEASLGYEKKTTQEEEEIPFTPHAGIDESGKGDFFGPLVVAAVFVDDESNSRLSALGVKDSKLIKSDVKILKIAKEIRTIVKGDFSVMPIGPEAYNRLYNNFKNLNRLLAWGHSRTLENLLEKEIDCPWALADKFGNEELIKNALFNKGKNIILKQQTKAESDIAVAAASILARAEFVTRIKKLGDDLNTVIPKGASAKVLEKAAQILDEHGIEKLDSISKNHFRTRENVLEKAKN